MAKASFVYGTDAQIEQLEVTNGQLIVSDTGSAYVDMENSRIPITPDEDTIIAVYDTTVATMAHSVSDYVYVNNYIYRVTSAIAIGDTIAVGTNVVLATDIEADTPIYVTGLPDSSIGIDADNVDYDNSTSGLTADNVQDAIDELANAPVPTTNIEAVYEETTALSAHAIDDYIYMNDLLYRVTSAIAIGDSIVVNTNVELANDLDEGTEIYIANLPNSGGDGSLPEGGTTGQVLAKRSNTNYDVVWTNPSGGGSGFKIIVTAPIYPNQSITVTESDSGDTVTETTDANGVATFEVSAGTWTATTLDSGTTVTLGSVTVGTTGIEYSGVKFAFHYSENDSSPDSVTYPSGYNNSDWGSDTAYMDFTNDIFHYGNWDPSGTNAAKLSWLFPKPCMLKSDGTVDYYLDPNDYTKKADGTASDIANTSYDGNAMMEWGQGGKKIYWKIIPDNDNKGFTFCVANYKADGDYDCWNHYDCDNTIKDHFYTPIYFGSLVDNKLRSLSGQANSVSTTRQNEINYATANNTDSKVHWYTEVYSDWLLQGMLTTLITKSLDSQTKIGKGRSYSNNSSAINTGTMNTKGLFWGSTNGTDGVKCWGMENPWGNLWRAVAGFMNINNTVKIKLTYGNHDGTSVSAYNLDGSGYLSQGSISGTSGGYISHMNITTKGITPATVSGSDSTYYCDGAWFSSGTMYAFVGGDWVTAAGCGLFCASLSYAASFAYARVGAALSYK